MINAQHHKHVRKRIFKYKQPFPSRNSLVSFFDLLVTWLGLGTSLVTLHQAYIIFNEQDAGSVSILAWLYFTIFTFSFLCYGILHNEKPLIAIYLLLTISNGLVVAGAVIY